MSRTSPAGIASDRAASWQTLPAWTPQWLLCRPALLATGLAWLNPLQRYPLLLPGVALVSVATGWLVGRRRFVSLIETAATYSWVIVTLIAVHTATWMTQRRSRIGEEHLRSWLTPLPRGLSARTRIALVAIVALTVLALLLAISCATGSLAIAAARSILIAALSGIVLGALASWCMARMSRTKGEEGLHAGYDAHRVLLDVHLTIARGEWFALLGPNASGKTTLLHCIGGMLAPSAGNVSVCGHSLKSDPRAAKTQLGFAMAQERLPKLLTGRQCLEVYAAAKDLRSIDADVLELAEAFRFTPMLDLFMDAYSLGSRQKLAVLPALLGEPALIVLDEAFNGLDAASSLVLKHHLRDRVAHGRCGVLLAMHALDIVERYANRAGLLLEGRIVHEWTSADVRALPNGGFEAAVAEVTARADSVTPARATGTSLR